MDGEIDRPFIDRDLDQSIRKLQRDLNLREDGIMTPKGETEHALNIALRLTQTSEENESSDSDIESEILPPPNIPGTDIPDEGIPEGVDPDGIGHGDPDSDRYEIDPDIEVNPPTIDPNIDPSMEIIPPFPGADIEEEEIAALISFLKNRR